MEYKEKYDSQELLRRFYEGDSSLREEEALREFTADDFDGADDDRATAIMSELFRQERAVGYPAKAMPLRRTMRLSIFVRIAAAAAAAILVTLGSTLWRHEHTVYCLINGEPVTDYEMAMKQSAIAIDIMSESMEKTAEMLDPLDEVGRAVRELEQTGIFDAIIHQPDTTSNNS